MRGEIDLNDPYVVSDVRIVKIRRDSDGDYIISLMAEGEPHAICLFNGIASWSQIRNIRRWCRDGTPVFWLNDPENGRMDLSAEYESNRLDQILDASQTLYDNAGENIDALRDMATTITGAVIHAPIGRLKTSLIQRYLG